MKKIRSAALSLLFAAASLVWLWPLAVVVINSFKKKAYISRMPFALPTERM